jgi:hypothetical protein
MMNWRGHERKRSWPILMYCHNVCLEALTKTTENSSPLDSNLGSLGYEIAVMFSLLFSTRIEGYNI